MRRASSSPRHAVVAQLQLEVGQDRGEVGVAAALAVAVHRALHQAGAALHGRQRVGDAAAGVVVGVDADCHVTAELGHHRVRGLGQPAGQRGAVGVAQRHVLGARLGGGAQAAQGVARVVGVGVEEVLGVVDHALALAAQEGDRLGDHPQVLLWIHARDLLEVQRPRLAHQRADRGEAVGQSAQAGVVLGRRVPAAGHAERRDLGVLEALALQQLEQRHLLGVGAGEARLDVVQAQAVEGMRHADLLVHGKGHALALHPIAKGGVVEVDLLGHWGERLSAVTVVRAKWAGAACSRRARAPP